MAAILIGRSLTVDLELVSTWGSSIGEDVVQVTSEGCMWNGELQYDYVYTVSYSCNCPTSLAAIPEDQSGPWGVNFVGRTLCIDGNCTTEGSTAGTPEPESWDCAQHQYDYTRYWTQGPKIRPKPAPCCSWPAACPAWPAGSLCSTAAGSARSRLSHSLASRSPRERIGVTSRSLASPAAPGGTR